MSLNASCAVLDPSVVIPASGRFPKPTVVNIVYFDRQDKPV